MKRITQLSALFLGAALIAGPALAQELIVYPSQGQSQEQMEKDKFECYTWAKQQTGFDPMQIPQASQPPPQQEAPQGGAVRGAARGAAVGTVVGGIAGGEWGKGAAAGAAGGALLGGMRRQDQRRQQQQAQKQWEEQQVAEYTQKRNAYDRAYSACLEGKGYTVK
ncbi:MAG: hypothetical protein GTO14_01610 [Anaerolineales bacterium]|nr:hypothetical protein [Anaerolineales bacterium]